MERGKRDWGPDSAQARYDETGEIRLSIEPSARVYIRTRRPVKPFVLVGAGIEVMDRDATTTGVLNENDTDEWFGRTAIGVEWFPMPP